MSASTPIRYRFPGQKHSEVIKLLVRKHWMVDFKIALFFLFLAGTPAILGVIAPIFFWEVAFTDAFLLGVLALWIYLLFMLLITFIKWLNQELDVIIVTNERIVSHDQIDLFHRQISETSIAQVQDVKGVEKGFMGHMLHFGALEVQTAARDIVFTIQDVAQPYQSARLILDVRDKYLDKEKFEKPKDSAAPIFDF